MNKRNLLTMLSLALAVGSIIYVAASPAAAMAVQQEANFKAADGAPGQNGTDSTHTSGLNGANGNDTNGNGPNGSNGANG
jgi:hypothetical protein